jgi:hypothetical protein
MRRHPPVASNTISTGRRACNRATTVVTPASSSDTAYPSALGRRAISNAAWATSMPTKMAL